MKKLVAGFQHKFGSHCSSTLMRDVLAKYEINLTEELCFGIGSGLGFLYRKCWTPAYYMVLGRGHDLEEKIGQHFGFFTEIDLTYDNEIAWSAVKKLIDDDKPVLLDVDASELPYMRKKFDLFDLVRYGGHKVCMVGYDEENALVFLYDYAWQDIQVVDREILKRARSADVGEFPAANMWISFAFPQKPKSLEDAIVEGIGFNVHIMKHPVTNQTGLRGMEKFLKQVAIWPYTFAEEHAKKNAYIAYMMLETVGTGGGNFRRIYARFLRQAGEILDDSDIKALSGLYFDAGECWRKIAKELLESNQDISLGIYKNDVAIKELLTKTMNYEMEGMDRLEDIIKKKYKKYLQY